MELKHIAVYVDGQLRYLSCLEHDASDIRTLRDLADAERNDDILSDFRNESYAICTVEIVPARTLVESKPESSD